MSDYLEIKYKGDYEDLKKFFEEKSWDFEGKRISPDKAIFKIAKEAKDEINFFLQVDLNDGNLRMEDIQPSSEEAYENSTPYEEPEEEEPIIKFDKEEDLLLMSERKYPEEPSQSQFNINNLSANCPAKAVLKDEDPMKYLTSPSFMGKFFIVGSLILFIMNILG